MQSSMHAGARPRQSRRALLSVAALLLATMAMPVPHAGAGERTRAPDGVVAPDERLFGKSYSDLVDAWSNWAWREPAATNPVLDPDGSDCARNQKGRFWFLAGTLEDFNDGVAQRTCTVPAGRAIFFPISNGLSFAPDYPEEGPPANVCLGYGRTVDAVRCDVDDDLATAPGLVLTVTIDGRPVPDLLAYRAQSRPGGFTFRIEPGSFWPAFGMQPGPRFPAVAAGYWMLLKPLRPGIHRLAFSSESEPGKPLGARYTLIVR
jgi:hypothetical protein